MVIRGVVYYCYTHIANIAMKNCHFMGNLIGFFWDFIGIEWDFMEIDGDFMEYYSCLYNGILE